MKSTLLKTVSELKDHLNNNIKIGTIFILTKEDLKNGYLFSKDKESSIDIGELLRNSIKIKSWN